MLDSLTRHNLALQDAACKGTSDMAPLFESAAGLAGFVPTVLASDKAGNFHAAWKDLYRAKNFMQPPTFHVWHIHAGRTDRNNSQMERFNRELRAFERCAGGIKTMRTSPFRGMRIHHNFVRPRMGLGSGGDGHDGLTPARAARIFVQGQNVWMVLVQNARLHQGRRGRLGTRGGGSAVAAASVAGQTQDRPDAHSHCRGARRQASSKRPGRRFAQSGVGRRMIAPVRRPQTAGRSASCASSSAVEARRHDPLAPPPHPPPPPSGPLGPLGSRHRGYQPQIAYNRHLGLVRGQW